MKPIKLILLTLAILLLLTSQAWAERAMWVWSMADDIVLNTGSRAAFFEFCAAPHGDNTKAITVIYLSGRVRGKDLVTQYAPQLRNFLNSAHYRGIKVECLEGDKSWATPEHRPDAEARCDEIISFNKGGASDNQRFDGIHYDVEPYLLSYDNGDSYDWKSDNGRIWLEYLTLLENCQAKVDVYNASYTDIKFGVAIPWWYDDDAQAGTPEQIQSRVDYIAIMDYRENGASIVGAATGEIESGNQLGKEVFIGVETGQAVPPDPESITFYEEGNTYMEGQLAYVASELGANPSFAGFAIHYYEDLDAGETAYRGLCTTGEFPGYQPIVRVIFPNGDEGIDFTPGETYNIRWTTIDQDTDSDDLSISIEYSSDGGNTWRSATGQFNDGSYAWNTTGLSDGDEYRIKVIATDPTSLIGYDKSNYNFTFSSTPSPIPEWTSGRNTGVNGIKPIIIPDGDIFHMVWYWPGWGDPLLEENQYAVYYRKSKDRGSSWGPKIKLAGSNVTQPRKPALAVRGNTLAVVWVEGAGPEGAKKVKVRISTDGGNTWGSAEEIQEDYTYFKWADFPDITIDANNDIHVVWGTRLTAGSYHWIIHYNSKVGGVWTGVERVGDTSYYIATPAITSDANGVHVVWGEYNWSSGSNYIIRYRKKTDTWDSVKNIVYTTATSSHWTKYFPRICSDDSGKLHVVWQTAGDNPKTATTTTPPLIVSDIYYSSSSDGGDTWLASPECLAEGYVPALSLADDELRIIYYVPSSIEEKGDIRYRKSEDGGSSWSDEVVITTDACMPYWKTDVSTIVGSPSLASDSLGNMVAAWRGFSNERIMLSSKGVRNPPTSLFADIVYDSFDSLKLRWEKPEGYTPNYYSLYRSQDGQDYSSVAEQIYDMEYTDIGLSGTSYYKYKVTAVEGTEESVSSNVSNVLYPADTFVIDYLEGHEGISYSKAGESDLLWVYDISNVQEGNQSMKLSYTYAGSGWGAVLKGDFPINMDISHYSIVSIWVRGGTVEGEGIAVQFNETGRPEGDETWSSSSPVISDTGWQRYDFFLNDFTRTSKETNDNFDRTSVGSYQLFFSENSANGNYWVDRIELHKAPAFLEATPSEVNFGHVSANVDDHRFQILPPAIDMPPAINIRHGGLRTPWTVRIWTNNSPGGGPEPDKAGLVGVDEDTGEKDYITLKTWCANYGPSAFTPPPGPDEENDYFWSGYDFNGDKDKDDALTSGYYAEASYGFDINGNGNTLDIIEATLEDPLTEEPVWMRVPEKDEMEPGNKYSWRRLCWNDGQGDDAGCGGYFDIYLAIDASGVKPQEYNTTLTIEYINW